jgi:hypothetical protein
MACLACPAAGLLTRDKTNAREAPPMQQHGTYPFGDPICARPPSADDPRSTWILGAYPSALHVRWEPPAGNGLAPVAAFPVADEPTRSGTVSMPPS